MKKLIDTDGRRWVCLTDDEAAIINNRFDLIDCIDFEGDFIVNEKSYAIIRTFLAKRRGETGASIEVIAQEASR